MTTNHTSKDDDFLKLAEVLAKVVPFEEGGWHEYTMSFQALKCDDGTVKMLNIRVFKK